MVCLLRMRMRTPETEPIELPDLAEQPDESVVEPDADVTKEEDEPGKVQEVTPEQKPTEQKTPPSKPAKNNGAGSGTEVKPTPSIDNGGYIEGQVLPKEPKFVKGILLANKKYPLPTTYAPGEDKKARGAFERMAAEAKLAGFNLNALAPIARLNTRRHFTKDMLPVMVKKRQIRTVHARVILNTKQGSHST